MMMMMMMMIYERVFLDPGKTVEKAL